MLSDLKVKKSVGQKDRERACGQRELVRAEALGKNWAG